MFIGDLSSPLSMIIVFVLLWMLTSVVGRGGGLRGLEVWCPPRVLEVPGSILGEDRDFFSRGLLVIKFPLVSG